MIFRRHILLTARLAVLTGFAVLLSSCTPTASTPANPTTAIAKMSQALDDIAKGVGAAQTVVIQANLSGFISTQDTAAIFGVCQKINTAGQQVSTMLRSMSTLNATTAVNIPQVLAPMVTAVQQALTTGILGIKDPTTRTNFQNALLGIQTALTTAQIILSNLGVGQPATVAK